MTAGPITLKVPVPNSAVKDGTRSDFRTSGVSLAPCTDHQTMPLDVGFTKVEFFIWDIFHKGSRWDDWHMINPFFGFETQSLSMKIA